MKLEMFNFKCTTQETRRTTTNYDGWNLFAIGHVGVLGDPELSNWNIDIEYILSDIICHF